MRFGSALWLRFEDSPAPFLRFGSLRFETCVLRLELRFGCVLKTVLHFSCVLKLRLELRFEPLRSAFAFRATLRSASTLCVRVCGCALAFTGFVFACVYGRLCLPGP